MDRPDRQSSTEMSGEDEGHSRNQSHLSGQEGLGNAVHPADTGGGGLPDTEPPLALPLQPNSFDELVVFQAAPLVWKDNDNNLHPIAMLDFDRERETLRDSVASAASMGSSIRLVFETATIARLINFLGTRDTEVLHFSCHGLPERLCFEDGGGGVHFLQVDRLRDLMSERAERWSEGRGELRFVFVSACYSRTAGEAFINAGVPHVVCCQQDEPLNDDAAVKFTYSFYSALLCGRTLLESFQLGKQAVNLAPTGPEHSAANEADKFLLLPETSDHDVPVFFTQPRQYFAQAQSVDEVSLSWILKRPPDKFMFREKEMYDILQKLEQWRLIKLTGVPGIGKRSLAAAVCRYINDRSRAFTFREVVWLPLMPCPRTDDLAQSLSLIMAMVQNSEPDTGFCRAGASARACGKIVAALHLTRALFVIDTKEFQQPLAIEKLSVFISELFAGVRDLNMILITHLGLENSFDSCCVEITKVELQPLSLGETATLFGMNCPYVADGRCPEACTPGKLSRLLAADSQENLKAGSKGLTKRSADIFQIIGEGIPAQIHAAARNLTADEYDNLIQIGKRKAVDAVYDTRFALEQQLSKLQNEKERAKNDQEFIKASELKEAYEELTRKRETLHDLLYLYKQKMSLKGFLAIAISRPQEDFRRADKLKTEISLLTEQIEKEEQAQDDAGVLMQVAWYKSRAKTPKKVSLGRKTKRKPFSVVISRGSVVSFKFPSNPDKSAIVNATNVTCMDLGGVDRAIAVAGGPTLKQARESLKVVDRNDAGKDVRCRTGKAKLIGPGSFHSLHVSYVILAVGPNYRELSSAEEGDKLLKSAYLESLAKAKDAKLQAVAFSLLCARAFRGRRSLEEVLRIGLEAISGYSGYDELREVHLCAYNSEECNALIDAAKQMNLTEVEFAQKMFA